MRKRPTMRLAAAIAAVVMSGGLFLASCDDDDDGDGDDVSDALTDASEDVSDALTDASEDVSDAVTDDENDEEGGAEEIEDEAEEFSDEADEDATAVDVTAAEYSFSFSSPTIEAGAVSFNVTNAGAEEHELGWAKLADGVTLEQALAFEGDPEEEGLLSDLGGNCCLAAGESGYANVELDEGTWAIVCFLPSPDGTPHAFLGMATTITVTG